MSAFNKTVISHQTSTPPSDSISPNLGKARNTDTLSQEHTGTTPVKAKTLGLAVRKLWTAIKQHKATLSKHWSNSKKHWQRVVQPHAKQSAGLREAPASCPEADNVADPASSPSPSTALIQETDSEPLPRPEPPVGDTTATESSISLSSQPEAIHTGPEILQPDVINLPSHQFMAGVRTGTPLSEASTLQNSTFVNGNISRGPSEVHSPSISEPERDTTVNVSGATPGPLPFLVIPPHVEINIGQSNSPGSDDGDSHTTIRGRGSSPASAVDFRGMGGHFEEPQVRT